MRRQHNWTAGEKLALTVECESHKTVSLKTRGFLLCAPFSFAPTNGSTPLGIPLNWLLVNGRPRVLCGEREGAQLSLLPCASIFFRLVRIVLRPSHSVTSKNDAGWVLRSLARWFNYGACQNISMKRRFSRGAHTWVSRNCFHNLASFSRFLCDRRRLAHIISLSYTFFLPFLVNGMLIEGSGPNTRRRKKTRE